MGNRPLTGQGPAEQPAGQHAWIAALLLLVAGAMAPPAAFSQTKGCGTPSTPACPPPAPIIAPFQYMVDPYYGRPTGGPFFSVGEAENWLSTNLTTGTSWCSVTPTGVTTDDNTDFMGVTGPVYVYGIDQADGDTIHYSGTAYTNTACATQWQGSGAMLASRTIACPRNLPLVYQSSPLVGPYCGPPPPQPPAPSDPLKAQGNFCRSGNSASPNSGGADAGNSRTGGGNPCDVSNGNKYQAEVDYIGSGSNPLRFVRSYNSFAAYYQGTSPNYGPSPVGVAWTATYFQRLYPVSTTDSTTTYTSIYAFRPDGRVLRFVLYGGLYTPDADVADTLTTSGSGYQYHTADDTVETYSSTGQLLTIAPRGRAPLTITYGIDGVLPATVSDAFGHSLQLTYVTASGGIRQLHSISDPAGIDVTYAYDGWGNLSSATYQDGTHRSYSYGVTNYSLTGITDEATVAFAAWTYSYYGDQVATSQHAGGVDNYSFTYSGSSRTVTDPLGTTRTYAQALIQNVYRVTGSTQLCPGCGEDQSRGYDANGNITARTDFNNVQTTYGYDQDRNLELTRTEAYGTARARTITTQWSTTWRQPLLVTEPNRTTAFTYDSLGNVLTKTVTDTATSTTRTWTYTYDSYGRMLTADGPRTDVSDVTTYAYYTCTTGYQCGQVNTVTNAAGQITTYNTYNAHGQPLTITDPNGTVTTLAYDLRQRLSSRQVGTELTSFAYYPTGLLQKVTLPDSSYIQYTYDNAHRLTQINDGAGNKIVYTLDAMGNRTAENAYDPTSVLSRTHTRVFNTLNQLYQDIGAANTSAVTTTFGYDSNGNQTTINAPLTRNTVNAFDELNRLKQVTDPASGITQYAYDANDNLTQVTDPRTLVTGYQYNGFGDVKQLTSPDTGVTTNTYDSGGNLATATDARSAITTYTYDALNRVSTVAYKVGSTTDQTITYTYDAGTNGKGRLTGASDANHSMTWIYDGLGRVASKKQTLGSVNQTVGYAYTNGDLITLTTPSGQTVTYGYSNGQVTAISVNSTTLLSSVAYEPFGPIRGWTWANSTTEVRLHDTDGNPSQISAIESSSFGYDDAYRITGITNSSNGALSWTYGYDLVDRLTSATKTGTTQGWTYDANGNRLTQTGTVAGTYTPSTTSNRLNSITGSPARTYSYDNAGDTLTYSNITFTYNDRGRMKTAKVGSSTTTYVYNALGQRIKKSGGSAGTVLTVYDEAGHLEGEYSSTGALVQETVWLGDTPVATLRPHTGGGIDIYYVHADHLNAPRMVTRPSDNKIAWRWDMDPFGTTAPNQNPQGLGTFVYGLRYPGQYYDSETGLNYNANRDYDPQIGRYVESDPIGLDGGVNTYAYALGSPILASDPSGLDVTVCYFPGGVGHVGVGVNSSDTHGLYPVQKQLRLAFCKDGAGTVQRDFPHHDWATDTQCFTIRTTPLQDMIVQQYIQDAERNKNQQYNLCGDQCTSFVRNALTSAGIPIPDSARYTPSNLWESYSQARPVNLFNNLQHAYSPARSGSW
jgi:RHS repeat-associated protein